MTLHPDDPKWTALALGELEETEQTSLRAELVESEEARHEVEEIEVLARQLTQGLRAQGSPGLTEAQKFLIKQAAVEQANLRIRGSLLRIGLPIAACFLMALSIYLFRASRPSEVSPQERFDARRSLPSIPPKPPAEEPGRASTTSQTLRQPQNTAPTGEPAAIPEFTATRVNPQVQSLLSQPGPNLPAAIEAASREATSVREFEEGLHLFATPSIIAPNPRMIAQVSNRVFGTVTDPTGAVVQGVSVEIRSLRSGLRKSMKTDLVGSFAFDGIDPGTLELKAELPGFKVFAQRQELASGSALRLDPVLQLGEVTETVEISSSVPAIQSESASISTSRRPRFPGWFSKSKKAPVAPPPPPAVARLGGTPSKGGIRRASEHSNTESYDRITDNPFVSPRQEPLSTFSVDVDTASYSNVRRFLNNRSLPPKDAVRIEEMINYFPYDYPGPNDATPFSANIEIASAPWAPEHRLARIGLRGREIPMSKRPSTNLVFLIDVSGSMDEPNKLPLVKRGLLMLVQKLNENDRVAIVVYAGSSGLVLPSTRCDQQQRILAVLEDLRPGGSTNGAQGIRLAYDIAVENFVPGGVNRVILATDGDFNVGVTNQGDLTRLIEEKAKSGVFLSVLGFGMSNIKDSTLEKLADKGNGHYAYIDTLNEARKVLVEEMGATLVTIAKDVKIQVEFNPTQVGAYRLIGYENRLLAAQDFNNDQKDAGEIGAGHTVTALYEIVPSGKEGQLPGVDPLKYQSPSQTTRTSVSNELLTLKLRYKHPAEQKSQLTEVPVIDRGATFAEGSSDFRLAAAVAAFGMVLRDSPYKGTATFNSIESLVEGNLGLDQSGYRREFLTLVQKAAILRRER